MRLLPLVLAILLGISPALANDPPSKPAAATPRPRMTTEQRFEQANTTRDGQLTLEQARQGYKTVARAFETIDATGKGFVTLEDVRAWQKAARDARQAARTTLNDPLRPRHAVQRGPAEEPAASATTVQGPMRNDVQTPTPETPAEQP